MTKGPLTWTEDDAMQRIEELEAEVAQLNRNSINWRERYNTEKAEVERLKQIEKSYIALHAISGELQAENERLRGILNDPYELRKYVNKKLEEEAVQEDKA